MVGGAPAEEEEVVVEVLAPRSSKISRVDDRRSENWSGVRMGTRVLVAGS